MKPKRVVRIRNKAPGIPKGAIYAGRPSQWGNPAKIGEWYKFPPLLSLISEPSILVANNLIAVDTFYKLFKAKAENDPIEVAAWLKPLIGRDVCCWCSLDQVCHCDVLLYFANGPFFNHYIPVIYGYSETPTNEGILYFVVPDRWPDLSEIVGSKHF